MNLDFATIATIIGALGIGSVLLEALKRRYQTTDAKRADSSTIVIKEIDDDAQFRKELREEVSSLRKELRDVQKDHMASQKVSVQHEADSRYFKRESERLEKELDLQRVITIEQKGKVAELQVQLDKTSRLLDETITELNRLREQIRVGSDGNR